MFSFQINIPKLPPNVFPAELYYGSGEWATDAIQTIKKLQTTMEMASAADPTLRPNNRVGTTCPFISYCLKLQFARSICAGFYLSAVFIL